MKKVLSMVLALVMVLGCMSMTALAAPANPELKSLTMSATAVNAPGSIEFSAEAANEDVRIVQATFYCKETQQFLYALMNKTYWTDEGEVPYEDGNLHGELYVNEFIGDGTFAITNLIVVGLNDQILVEYYSDYDPSWNAPETVQPMLDAYKDLQIMVSGSQNPDITPPVLKNITLSETVTTDPSKVAVTAEATDENSGIDYASMNFWCEETGEYLWVFLEGQEWNEEIGDFVAYADGKLHGNFEAREYKPGAYKLESMYVVDKAGNEAAYTIWNETSGDAHNPLMEDAWKQIQIEVVTEMPTVTYGDANGDGKVNAKDAMLVLQYYTNKLTEDKLDTKAVDVDGNGKINAKDAMLILQLYTNKLTEFPVQAK